MSTTEHEHFTYLSSDNIKDNLDNIVEMYAIFREDYLKIIQQSANCKYI